ELLVNTAKRCLPGQLIFELPEEVLKAILQDYPMEKKVEFIAILNSEQRRKIMGCYPKGSNGREMLEMELEVVESDEFRVQRLKRNANAITKDFTAFAREVLN